MKYVKLATCLLISSQLNASIINVGDTTLTSNWNAGGNILHITGKISGNYQLSNAIIDANLFMQIFDTTLMLGDGIQCQQFSAMWYGAKASNADNTTQLQMAINACINNTYPLYFPSAVYKSSSLWASIYDSVNHKYVQSTITMKGDAHYWGDGGAQIQFQGDDGIKFQLNKGSNISGLILKGGWISPGGSLMSYFNLKDSDYVNQGTTGNGFGIGIDTENNGSSSGSTGCYFHDMQITGFRRLISISNGAVQNGECLIFEKIQLGQGFWGVKTSQPQEKYNVFRDIYSWSSINYLFEISRGNYYVDGMNIAGRARNLINMSSGSFFPSYFKNIYAENLGSVGMISSWLAVSIEDCHFDFAYKSDVGERTLLTSNSNSVKFDNCNFRYYGNSDTLKFSGAATFENCYFSGVVSGTPNSVFIGYKNSKMYVNQPLYYIGIDTTIIQVPNRVKINLRKSSR